MPQMPNPLLFSKRAFLLGSAATPAATAGKPQSSPKPTVCPTPKQGSSVTDLYKLQAFSLLKLYDQWDGDTCRNQVLSGNTMQAKEYGKRLLECYDAAVSMMSSEDDKVIFRMLMLEPGTVFGLPPNAM